MLTRKEIPMRSNDSLRVKNRTGKKNEKSGNRSTKTIADRTGKTLSISKKWMNHCKIQDQKLSTEK